MKIVAKSVLGHFTYFVKIIPSIDENGDIVRMRSKSYKACIMSEDEVKKFYPK